MIERIKISLLRPSEIGKLFRDKMAILILFATIMVCLSLIPSFLVVSTTNTFPDFLKEDLKLNFYQFPNCQIENGKLNKCSTTSFKYLNFDIVFDIDNVDLTVNRLTASFEEDSLRFYIINFDRSKLLLQEFSYQELGVMNLDFGNIDVQAFNSMLDRLTISTKAVWGFLLIGYQAFLSIVKYLFYVFLLCFFMKHHRIGLPLYYRIRLAVYSCGICFIVTLISQLFGLSFLSYFDLLFGIIYINRAYSKIVRIEIK